MQRTRFSYMYLSYGKTRCIMVKLGYQKHHTKHVCKGCTKTYKLPITKINDRVVMIASFYSKSPNPLIPRFTLLIPRLTLLKVLMEGKRCILHLLLSRSAQPAKASLSPISHNALTSLNIPLLLTFTECVASSYVFSLAGLLW